MDTHYGRIGKKNILKEKRAVNKEWQFNLGEWTRDRKGMWTKCIKSSPMNAKPEGIIEEWRG